MQRAIAIAGLARGKSTLFNPTFSTDSLTAMDIMQKMGAKIEEADDKLLIEGGNISYPSNFSCRESGLSARMFAPVAAMFNVPITIQGEGSLLKRPQNVIEDTLKKFGVKVESTNGYLPVIIEGPMKPGVVEVDGSFTSQVITGLLIALPFIPGETTLIIRNLNSKPYVDITVEMLRDFGVEIERKGYSEFFIQGNQRPQPRNYTIEPDWSGLAFHLVGGAIAGEVEISMSTTESVQADRDILQILEQANASVSVAGNYVHVETGKLKAFEYDATDSPDLFPPLAVLALNAEGTTRIHGVKRLLHKESNRASALMDNFRRLGGEITVEDNTMYIKKSTLNGGIVHAGNDHRIAMAGAVAALNATGDIVVDDAESVNKSYPEFYEDFALLSQKQPEEVSG